MILSVVVFLATYRLSFSLSCSARLFRESAHRAGLPAGFPRSHVGHRAVLERHLRAAGRTGAPPGGGQPHAAGAVHNRTTRGAHPSRRFPGRD